MTPKLLTNRIENLNPRFEKEAERIVALRCRVEDAMIAVDRFDTRTTDQARAIANAEKILRNICWELSCIEGTLQDLSLKIDETVDCLEELYPVTWERIRQTVGTQK